MGKLFTIALAFFTLTSYGQDCLCNKTNSGAKDQICRDIRSQDSIINLQRHYVSTTDKFIPHEVEPMAQVITNYTWHRISAREFAQILIQENTFSALTRHADLKIDEGSSIVTFSPYVFHNSHLGFNPLRYFGSLEFSAKTSDQNIFRIYDNSGFNKEFKGTLNLNYVPAFGQSDAYYCNDETYRCLAKLRETARQEICCKYSRKLSLLSSPTHKACNDTCTNCGDTCCNRLIEILPDASDLCDSESLAKAIWNEFSENEEIIFQNVWTWRRKLWFTLSLDYEYQSFNGLDLNSGLTVPKNMSSPSLRVAVNRLWSGVSTPTSIYATAWVQINKKNSFTELQPTTWNKFQKLTDSTANIVDTKDVYAYDAANYSEKMLPTVGGQLIYMFRWYSSSTLGDGIYGLDFNLQSGMLPKLLSTENDYWKTSLSAGFIVPFNDKDGNRVINIEGFYRRTLYSLSRLESEDLVGLKFSVPIFSKN